MGIFNSKKEKEIIIEEIEEITPSTNINSILLNNNEMKNKYNRIKMERESYIKKIYDLETKYDKLFNRVSILEINERQTYTTDKRRMNSMNQLYDRIIQVETELKEGIILKAPKNNRPFLEPRKKY
tara:strand:+ start:1628 stop:2005 length:378 start_codon:yes stop_codon:yes gene_type:complete